MSEPLTRAERDALLARIREAEGRLYPPEGRPRPNRTETAHLLDLVNELLGEYADRLPRRVLSTCPFTGAPLRRAIDPFDLGGPWWQKDRTFTPKEPAPPPAFQTILGALDLRGRAPAETAETVLAGPDVPFVVPRLLRLPDMVAVVHRLELESGDVAYPIGYFSREPIHPATLHQHWTRPELWFETPEGESGWTVMNDRWDFDLAPWIESGRLRWVRPGDPKHAVVGADSGEDCPYVGLPGERKPQTLSAGRRAWDEPPNGEPPTPFES